MKLIGMVFSSVALGEEKVDGYHHGRTRTRKLRRPRHDFAQARGARRSAR
jgi:hypothetical protein